MPRSRYLIITLLTALVSGCATTQAPEISEDGLPRVSDDRFDTVYRMPDSDLGDYESLAMAPCTCLLYTSPSPRDVEESRMPSSA